ncbi:tetratricopeptide repeat protein [Streptomyces mirabilis]|uniref:tetratricopeptide repeat protein n=1 Tax=Streptomyces mirabilis TaxID=68239 RepID=UPI0036C8DA8C
MGLFTPQDATSYFTAVLAAHERHEPTDQINSLAADLGYLPLALAQAAAYVIDADLTCASYRELLADRLKKLADLLPEPGALPDDQAATVAATWSLSIERANQIRPAGLAHPMLQLLAFLNPNGIPATVLTSQPALTHLTEQRAIGTGGNYQSDQVSAEEVVLALRVLRRFSLIDHTPESPHEAVRVHQLIQRATREVLTPAQCDRLALRAADALDAAWRDAPTDTAHRRDTLLHQTLRTNVTALTRNTEDALHHPAPHAVLFRTGTNLGMTGKSRAARDHFQHLVTATSQDLGPEHPLTFVARCHLAHWRGHAALTVGATAADVIGAAAAFAELLADLLLNLGPDHGYTLETLGDFADWRGLTQDAVGAAAAYEHLLAECLRVLGPEHPDTRHARHRLDYWRVEAKDAVGAVAAFERLLDARLHAQGSDHPEILTARNQLAYLRWTAGDVAGAASAFEGLLADQTRVLGPDHPDTVAARGGPLDWLSHLATWRWTTEDAARAASAFEGLLADQTRVLGSDHPDTLNTRHNLAHWLGRSGDKVGAAFAFADLLTDLLTVQGPDHPDTLRARSKLASSLGSSGDKVGAASAFEYVLGELVRVLGPDHPRTLEARNNLGYWRGWSGNTSGAVAAFEDLLAERIRIQGPDHPKTHVARSLLASWQSRQRHGC